MNAFIYSSRRNIKHPSPDEFHKKRQGEAVALLLLATGWIFMYLERKMSQQEKFTRREK